MHLELRSRVAQRGQRGDDRDLPAFQVQARPGVDVAEGKFDQVAGEIRGDIVQAGVVITNSEVGHGSLTVQPLLYRLLCSNGLIAVDRTLRETHLGRITAQDEVGVTVFQDDTLRADDRAFFLKVRDVVQDAVSELTFRQLAQRLQRTRGIPLLGNPVKSVDVLGQRYHLNEDECSGVLRYLIEGGELSGYGLVNAVTHYSQALDDYDRATEFEALGGKLIELPAQEWRQLAEAA